MESETARPEKGRDLWFSAALCFLALVPRLYVALLETYQQTDGSIALPEPLRRYFGAERIG